MSLSTKKVNKVSSVELIQIERRISIPQLQVRGALSGGEGGCLCQWELKAPTDRSQSDCVHEQAAKADCECPLYKYIRWEMTLTSIGGEKQASISGGSQSLI